MWKERHKIISRRKVSTFNSTVVMYCVENPTVRLICRQAGFSEKSLKNSNSFKKDQDTFIPYADKLWLASGCVLATALQNAGINSPTVKEALFKTGNPFFVFSKSGSIGH
jgi:hypothetical protein